MDEVVIRPAREDDCDAVAAMVRRLSRLFGVEALTEGETLRRHAFGAAPAIGILVAEQGGALAGYLIHHDAFSTYLGQPGVFVVDLYVEDRHRNARIGERLLAEAARRGLERGAAFMRLDLDRDNHAGARFYGRLGFVEHEHDVYMILRRQGLAALADRPVGP